MADSLDLDVDAVAASVKSLTGIHADLDRGFSAVVNHIEKMLVDSWFGGAAVKYRELYGEVRSEVEELMADVQTLTSSVPVAIRQFQALDNGQAGALAHTTSSLNLPPL